MALAGKTIAFTGEMVGMTRKEATAVAMAAGATVGSATSKNVQFLFAGHGATPAKTMKAQQNGVNVLAAPQFAQWTQGIKAPVAAPMMAAPVMAAPMAVAPVAVFAPVMAAPVAPKKVAVQAPMGAFAAPNQKAAMFQAPAQTYAAPAPVAAAPMAQQPTFAYPAEFAPKATRGRRPAAAMMAAPMAAPVAVAAPMPVMPMAQQPQMMFVPYVAATQPVFTHQAVALAGKSVAFTGSFECGNRAGVGAMAEQLGAVVHSAVMPNTDMLVCGISAHETKLAAAKQMGVRNVSEQQFVAAVAPVAPVAQMPTAYGAPAAPRMTRVKAPVAFQGVAAPAVQAMGPVQLAGQNVVFTGALQVNRFVAATMASKAGAVPSSSLSTKTNLLVCGANAGEKMAKAQSMGVRCVSEADFVAACRM